MTKFDKLMAPTLRQLGSSLKGLDRATSKPLTQTFCPDHWENIILFGKCWKHEEDGSLKRLFAKKV